MSGGIAIIKWASDGVESSVKNFRVQLVSDHCSINAVVFALAIFFLVAVFGGSSAKADWRKETGTFRIGLVDMPGRDYRDLKPVEDYFSAALGMPVKIFIARDYAALIDAHVSARIEYAAYSALAYATALHLCQCIVPLAAPQSVDGVAGTRSVLLLHANTLSGDQGNRPLRVAVAEEDSLVANVLPRVSVDSGSILIAGKKPELVPHESMNEAIRSFLENRTDGLFGWVPITGDGLEAASGGTIEALEQRGMKRDDIRVAWSSGNLLNGPHAIRKNVPDDIRELLSRLLSDLHSKKPEVESLLEPVSQGGFSAVSNDGYRPAIFLVDHLASTGHAD